MRSMSQRGPPPTWTPSRSVILRRLEHARGRIRDKPYGMSLSAAPQHSPMRLTLAWGVHLFTASGAVFGTLAILAVLADDFDRAALLMLLTLFIDAVDGTLARAVGVTEVLPSVNGPKGSGTLCPVWERRSPVRQNLTHNAVCLRAQAIADTARYRAELDAV